MVSESIYVEKEDIWKYQIKWNHFHHFTIFEAIFFFSTPLEQFYFFLAYQEPKYFFSDKNPAPPPPPPR